MCRKTRVVFGAEGGTLAFERGPYGVSMWVEDDCAGNASLLFTPTQWQELCDFFAHPEVCERFDVGHEEESNVLNAHDKELLEKYDTIDEIPF